MRRSAGARLWLQPARYKDGKLYEREVWVIRDRSRKISTGCTRNERAQAEQKLAGYLAEKYEAPRDRNRHPAQILVADVLNIYLTDKVPEGDPNDTAPRFIKLGEFFETDTLADINGARCRAYVTWRTKQVRKACKPGKTGRAPLLVTTATARRELEDLRAAVNFHRREGLCSEVVAVALPEKGEAREVWLTRSEAAKLIRTAWRARQGGAANANQRRVGRHIARFLLVGCYTGTRHGAITGAALTPAIGRGYVALERGVFHRQAAGARATKKRQPPVRNSAAPAGAYAPLGAARDFQDRRHRVERRAGHVRPQSLRLDSEGGRTADQRPRQDHPACLAPHRGDLGHAKRGRPLAGGRLPRDDGGDVAGALWSPSP